MKGGVGVFVVLPRQTLPTVPISGRGELGGHPLVGYMSDCNDFDPPAGRPGCPAYLYTIHLRATDNRYNLYNQNRLCYRLTDDDLLIVRIVLIL